MQQLKKLTAKDVMGTIEVGSRMVLGGVAYGYFSKVTTYGESIAIEGDFVAQNIKTGEQFTAPVVYLPNDTASSVMRRLENREDQAEAIEVKFDISVVPSDKSKTGYTFLVAPLATEESMNAKKTIANVLAQSANLLEAPKAKK